MPKKTVKCDMPSDELMCDLADLYKIFGDTTRIKIMYFLLGGGATVNTIADKLNMTQSAISHQLKTLKDANLVDGRREGKNMIYALSDDHVMTIIDQGFEHLTDDDHDHDHK